MNRSLLALLGLALAGCAPRGIEPPATQTQAVQAVQAASGAQASTRSAGSPSPGPNISDSALAEAGASLASVEQQFASGSFEPEMIHEARIAMARQELVDDNRAKERMDVAEELERELATLQNSGQTGKSRHARTTSGKKHP